MKRNWGRRSQSMVNALLRRQQQELTVRRREAEIEAGLDSVRSKAMAMQSSEELASLAATVITELRRLDVALSWCLITILDEASWSCKVWRANSASDPSPQCYVLPFADYPFQNAIMRAWKERREQWTYELKGEEKKTLDEYMFTRTDYKRLPQPVQNGIRSLDTAWFSFSFGAFGGLQVGGPAPLSDANLDILGRFGKVFDLTYTRFNDLQNAEAQAREARIEAALERVRTRTMAMRSSKDMSDTTIALFEELVGLGITRSARSGVGILNEPGRLEVWSASALDGNVSLNVGYLGLNIHPLFEGLDEAYRNGKTNFTYELEGEDLLDYYRAVNAAIGYTARFDLSDLPSKEWLYSFYFADGIIFIFSREPLTSEAAQIYKRFAAVFDLTYRRFLDLQQAETSSRVATRQASLDRVRAEIASMRTTADLERITPLVWRELTNLGVPFIRCGIFLMDEAKRLIHSYLSTPDGKAIAAFPMAYDTEGIGRQVLLNWYNKSIFTGHWNQLEFKAFYQDIARQGALESQEMYETGFPTDGLYLHFVPFLQGMLYVGNSIPLTDGEIRLIQSLTGAFATAYARYDDFVRLESAKQEVDRTLSELKAAQSQLIQSEKMASLGELTAGIAHEIQNPLNFVNNFSEVNIELIDEMKIELAEGNHPAATALSDDIRQNLEKINFHGKRADSIVKNMLQHSRKSTGQKEAADINALTDEYLRLCYHGLRAKEKWFNVKLETQYAEELPKARIVTQDIGRVLLNLFTNAFYSLIQKVKKESEGFQPLIRVVTAQSKDMVEIRIRDNGIGIPASVLDKIYHPFFTTKPAGDGTGLGLSLSYDIITKEHSGTIEVATAEGEYAEFILRLPI
jgi:signal transduction histidine kinase